MNGDRILALISSKLWFQAFSTQSVHDMTTDPSSEYIFIVQVDSSRTADISGSTIASDLTTAKQASTGNILKYDLLMPDKIPQTKITGNDLNGQIVCKLSQYSDTLILGAQNPQANQTVLMGL